MKNLILIPASVLLVAGACAQKNDQTAPDKVREAFTAKFQDVKQVEWSKESETEWEAEFKKEGVEYSAVFDETGNWIETEHEVKAKDLPAAVSATLTQQFADYKIEAAEIAEKGDGISYEVEIEKGEVAMEVVLREDGSVVSKEEIKEDNED